MKMRWLVTAGAALLLAGAGVPSSAAPCAGFTDVDTVNDAGFCPSVEWIRNRGVTTGCNQAGTLYCPAQAVSRLAMAAFMKRLGAALTAQLLPAQPSTGALDLDLFPVVCPTGDFAVTSFPRRAYLDLAFAGRAAAVVDVTAQLVFSTNGGATWSPVNTVAPATTVAANEWGNASDVGTKDLDVGQTVRFGARVTRIAGSADLTDSRCNLRALVNSRDGASSPF